MPVTKDTILLFQSHECSSGLDDEAIRDICDVAELVEYAAGEYLHQSNQPIDSVHLVVHGRLKQSIVDMHGNILLQRFLTRGGQFGALAAAQAEPVPIEVVAVEPSAVLKLDFESTLRFTRKHETFGLNLTRSLSNMIHQVLLQDRRPKKPSLVTIFHESPASRPLTHRVVDRLVELGESPSVMSDHIDWEAVENVRSRSLMEEGRLIGRDDIRRQINEWPDSERVILDVDSALDPVNAALWVEFSEQVFWCTSSQGIESSTYRLKAVEGRAPGWRDKINLVWILEADQRTSPPAAELNRLVGRDFKVSTSETQPNQGRALLDGFERLIHQLRGVRIGLALGGGGARGMAHLGVLKALESSGLVVDRIAGTSAGAMTGTIYAAGLGADYLTERFVEDLKPGWPFRMMPRGDYWYLLYKYRRGHFDRMLRKYLRDWTLEQLPLPVQTVTVDLVTGKMVVRDRGDAVSCILESINLPVFSKPICRDGQALVDGGLVNNVPANVLVRDGCNFVIAVSVTARLEAEFGRNRPNTPTAEMRSASTLQTILRSHVVQSVNMNSVGVNPADVVIEPNVTSVELSEFSRTNELAAIGEEATMKSIPHIKSLLAQVDRPLFRTC